MKKMIHCCFTSHQEVMFRSPQDVGFFLNLLALTSWKYGVDIFADTEMSNHVHLLLFSSDKTESRLSVGPYSKTVIKPGFDRDGSILYSESNQLSVFITALRKRYTWYFTQKYQRDCGGRMGEKYYFSLIIEGNYHMISACSYVLRNGLHHGVSGTSFMYPYSSINDMFIPELGKTERPYQGNRNPDEYHKNRSGHWIKSLSSGNKSTHGLVFPDGYAPITSRNVMKLYLPRYSEWPDDWVMSPSGVFLRSCFEQLRQTELLFVSPGAFEYNMFRKTDEKWLEEQDQDRNGKPAIGISDIEPIHNEDAVKSYLYNERAATFRNCRNDIDLCGIIDRCILPEFKSPSIYQLSRDKRESIKKILMNDFHVSDSQASRCLWL